jgi:hypothetical protein
MELITTGHLNRIKKVWEYLHDNFVVKDYNVKTHSFTREEMDGYESRTIKK